MSKGREIKLRQKRTKLEKKDLLKLKREKIEEKTRQAEGKEGILRIKQRHARNKEDKAETVIQAQRNE